MTNRVGGERGANFDSSIVSSLLPWNNFFALETLSRVERSKSISPAGRGGVRVFAAQQFVELKMRPIKKKGDEISV